MFMSIRIALLKGVLFVCEMFVPSLVVFRSAPNMSLSNTTVWIDSVSVITDRVFYAVNQ